MKIFCMLVMALCGTLAFSANTLNLTNDTVWVKLPATDPEAASKGYVDSAAQDPFASNAVVDVQAWTNTMIGLTGSWVTASITNNAVSTGDVRKVSLPSLNRMSNVWVDASGNVGIGTNIPSSRLHVTAGAGNNAALTLGQADANASWLVGSSIGGEYILGANKSMLRLGASSSISTSNLTIHANGHVGVNTTNQTEQFEVLGSTLLIGGLTVNNDITGRMAVFLKTNTVVTSPVSGFGGMYVDANTNYWFWNPLGSGGTTPGWTNQLWSQIETDPVAATNNVKKSDTNGWTVSSHAAFVVTNNFIVTTSNGLTWIDCGGSTGFVFRFTAGGVSTNVYLP